MVSPRKASHHILPGLCRPIRRASHALARVSESTARSQWDSAVRYGVAPVLLHHWQIDCQALPPELVPIVNQHDLQTRQRVQLLAIYSRAILSALQKNGLKVIIYKGLPLSVHLYGDDIVRNSSDIDLLVLRDDLPAISEQLESLGLGCVIAPEWLSRRLLTDNFFEVEWRDGLVAVEVDVHWRLAPRWIPHVDMTSQMLHARTEIKVGGQMWPWCSAGQIWYIQLVELIKANWLEPKSLVSFAHAWDIVLRDGDEHAAGLLLRTLPATLADCAMLLLSESLHRRVPDEWVKNAQQNWLAGAAARCINGVYFAPHPSEKLERARWVLRAVRYVSCGWALPHTIFNRVFTPHYSDLAAVQPTASRGRLAIAKMRRVLDGRKRHGRIGED